MLTPMMMPMTRYHRDVELKTLLDVFLSTSENYPILETHESGGPSCSHLI
jgi:hypothetical protein